AIGERLARLGFKVVTQLDAGRDAMQNAVADYGEQLARHKGVGLFYFAGHGLQLAWRNFLVPVDANLTRADDVLLQTLDLRQLFDRLGKAGNAMNVIILDACRDNPFGSELKTGKGLSQMDAPIGTLLAYATAPGNLASDGSGDNGLYTEHLLREIGTPEAKIEDVFKRVRLAVRRASSGQQVPWESTSLEDDFYFIPPPDLKKLSQEELDRQF
ncbi:MAG: caspase family protein, partial [Rhodocyclaceae bacterium]|nr:caspase family protein [Rhodocyclaceae bacterium]